MGIVCEYPIANDVQQGGIEIFRGECSHFFSLVYAPYSNITNWRVGGRNWILTHKKGLKNDVSTRFRNNLKFILHIRTCSCSHPLQSVFQDKDTDSLTRQKRTYSKWNEVLSRILDAEPYSNATNKVYGEATGGERRPNTNIEGEYKKARNTFDGG